MGTEFVFLFIWIMAALAITVIAIASKNIFIFAATMSGGLIGFSPLFLFHGPQVWAPFFALYKSSLATIALVCLFRGKQLAASAFFVLLAATFAHDYAVDLPLKRLIYTLVELMGVVSPLFCALAAKNLAACMRARHEKVAG